jgi:spectrin beta
MERDLAAIQAKLDSLESEADVIGDQHPEEAALIRYDPTFLITNDSRN